MSDRPILPCPSWCAVDHERSGTISHQAWRYIGGDWETGFVALYLSDYGTGKPALASLNGSVSVQVYWRATDKIIDRPLEEAERFAETAEAFGRPDIATLIRELAEVAGGAR